MSASLVGSEMCIRDRLRVGESRRPPIRRSKRRRHRASRGASCAWQCSAVSYTHLTLPTICSV
eukprot:13470809-Alexandrium_andersonii.AAC.1